MAILLGDVGGTNARLAIARGGSIDPQTVTRFRGEDYASFDDVVRQFLVLVREAFGARDGVTFDELDGLTVSLPDGSWFNLRASNTEPLLRLNVEAPDAAAMAGLRDEVLGLVRA